MTSETRVGETQEPEAQTAEAEAAGTQVTGEVDLFAEPVWPPLSPMTYHVEGAEADGTPISSEMTVFFTTDPNDVPIAVAMQDAYIASVPAEGVRATVYMEAASLITAHAISIVHSLVADDRSEGDASLFAASVAERIQEAALGHVSARLGRWVEPPYQTALELATLGGVAEFAARLRTMQLAAESAKKGGGEAIGRVMEAIWVDLKEAGFDEDVLARMTMQRMKELSAAPLDTAQNEVTNG